MTSSLFRSTVSNLRLQPSNRAVLSLGGVGRLFLTPRAYCGTSRNTRYMPATSTEPTELQVLARFSPQSSTESPSRSLAFLLPLGKQILLVELGIAALITLQQRTAIRTASPSPGSFLSLATSPPSRSSDGGLEPKASPCLTASLYWHSKQGFSRHRRVGAGWSNERPKRGCEGDGTRRAPNGCPADVDRFGH